MHFALCLVAAFCLVLPAQAQVVNPFDPSKMAVTQYKIDGWQIEQGLSQNTVQSVFQAKDGYLWVGTGGGVACFEGIRFATFEDSEVLEIATRPISGFMEDAEGRLWIGHSRGATTYRNRAGDFAARIGGEEFIVLIPGADRAAAAAFAESLRAACEARAIAHPASPVAPVVTLSLGVAAAVPTAESNALALVAEADAALYSAKKFGRNRVR